MNSIFRTQTTVRFREGDPAQIMFFGNVFGIAHDAFEQFLGAAGFTWKEWFQSKEFIVPIRQTEADFLAPFFPGETYDIQVSVAHIGKSSFKMKYVFSQAANTHAIVSMVHTVLDAHTKTKIALPSSLTGRIEKFLEKAAE